MDTLLEPPLHPSHQHRLLTIDREIRFAEMLLLDGDEDRDKEDWMSWLIAKVPMFWRRNPCLEGRY